MDNKLSTIKSGLGMIIFGTFAAIIMLLIEAIFHLAKISSGTLTTVSNVIYLLCSFLIILGICFCLLSGEKHFKNALIFYILLLIYIVVIAIIDSTHKVTIPEWVLIFRGIFAAGAHLSILLALKHVSKKRSFSALLISICILLFLVSILMLTLGLCGVIKDINVAVGLFSFFDSLETILLLIGVITTYSSLKTR